MGVPDRCLPALRVGEEELGGVGACGLCGRKRVGRVDVCADYWHGQHPTQAH